MGRRSGMHAAQQGLQPTPLVGGIGIASELLFAVEPSVALGLERVTVGTTVVTTANGCEELNQLGARLVAIGR